MENFNINQSYEPSMARKQSKRKAFATVKSNFKLLFFATLLASIPSIIVSGYSIFDTFNQYNNLFAHMGDLSMGAKPSGGASLIIVLISIFAIAPLSIGLYHLYMTVARGREQGSISMIFSRFHSGKRYWSSVIITLLILLFSFLWVLPVVAVVMIPMIIAVVVGMNTAAGIVIYIIGMVLYIIALFIYGAKVMTYEAAYFMLIDYEDISASSALKAAVQLYKGHIKEVLVFLLSFIGWYIVPMLVIGGISAVMVVSVLLENFAMTMGMSIGLVVVFVLTIIYMFFVGAYQSISFINLTDNLRERIGDTPWLPKENNVEDTASSQEIFNQLNDVSSEAKDPTQEESQEDTKEDKSDE